MSFNELLGGDRIHRLSHEAFASTSIFVDLGVEATEANITREGVKIPSLTLDPSIVDVMIDAAPRPRHKVLRQSIEAGRAVERGAVVNLVLVEPDELVIGIVGGVLTELGTSKIGEVYGPLVGDRPEIRRLLAKTGDPADLTDTDKEAIVGALGQIGVTVDPADDTAIAGAFTGLQTLHLFGG